MSVDIDKIDDRDDAAAELLRLTAEEMRADPTLTREQAAYRVRDRLQAKERPTPTRKEQPVETIQDIAKQVGLTAVCKTMIEENRSYGLSESEFTDLVVQQAKRDGTSFEQVFSRPGIFEAQRLLTKAYNPAPDLRNIT
ncbi:MAG TPA: hypothetical protein VIX37_07635, partial [Candidatus Sulfotelmatobacter sp.]